MLLLPFVRHGTKTASSPPSIISLEKCNNFETSRGSRGISVEGWNRSANGSRVIPRRAMALVHSDHWG